MFFLLFLRSDFCISFWYWRIYVSRCRRLYFFLKIWRNFTSRFCFKNWISKTTIRPIKVTILQTMLSGFILLLALSANTPSPKLKEGDKRSYSRRYTVNLFPQLLEKIESLVLTLPMLSSCCFMKHNLKYEFSLFLMFLFFFIFLYKIIYGHDIDIFKNTYKYSFDLHRDFQT